eukprot:4875070-Pleurochrysis_carterae.AAC.2
MAAAWPSARAAAEAAATAVAAARKQPRAHRQTTLRAQAARRAPRSDLDARLPCAGGARSGCERRARGSEATPPLRPTAPVGLRERTYARARIPNDGRKWCSVHEALSA